MGATWNATELEHKFANVMVTGKYPVAVTFLDAPPASAQRFSGSEPSGCSFWRLAAAGRTFYTLPENHFNCAVGAYTHNIALSPDREKETEQTFKMMVDLGYVKAEEVPQIPRLTKAPKAILYSPLGDAATAPDIVLFAAKPAGAMLLNEAANLAGVSAGVPALGRPTCMALPAALHHGAITSFGCIGNRVYTGLGEDEVYVVFRGSDLPRIADVLATIISANAALQGYAKDRRSQLSTV